MFSQRTRAGARPTTVSGGTARSGGRSPRLEERQLDARLGLFHGRPETFELRKGAKAIPDLADLRLVVFDVLVGLRRVPLARELCVLSVRAGRSQAGGLGGHLDAGRDRTYRRCRHL